MLIIVTAQRCIAVEMKCVFCSLELQQEVVTTLIVLLNDRKEEKKTYNNCLEYSEGKNTEMERKKKVLSEFQYSVYLVYTK